MPVTSSASSVSPGTVAHFAAATAPAGWIKANGALISRTAYAALFAAIGTTYGVGDGATTFAVPDLRGEFVRGLDDSRGVDSARAIGSAQAGQMPSHSHTTVFNDITGAGNWVSYAGGSQTAPAVVTVPTNSVGGLENASETRPRNVAMLACIKF